jgi:hypothetical protein
MALAVSVLGACAEEEGTDPAPHIEVAAGDADVRLVDRDEADLLLYVSNQSFDDEEVQLTVAVDDVTVVDADFHVEGQHNWISFPLSLPAGVHQITAESDTGATMTKSFRVPGDQTRYAVIDHWGADGSAELTWQFQRQPVAFA